MNTVWVLTEEGDYSSGSPDIFLAVWKTKPTVKEMAKFLSLHTDLQAGQALTNKIAIRLCGKNRRRLPTYEFRLEEVEFQNQDDHWGITK